MRIKLRCSDGYSKFILGVLRKLLAEAEKSANRRIVNEVRSSAGQNKPD